MQITYRIYSDHLAAFAPEGADVHTWSRDVYADTLRKTLETRWQDAEVEVDVISRTSGYGSGPEVTDDEGVPLDDIAIEVREISNRVLERLSQAEPATHRFLYDYKTGEHIREATPEEYAASLAAEMDDGGRGVIEIDGRSVYAV